MDTTSGQRDWRVYTYMFDYEKVTRYRRWYKMFSADTSGVVLQVVVGWEIGSLGGGIALHQRLFTKFLRPCFLRSSNLGVFSLFLLFYC
jgi:hypothetical protein